MCVCVCVCVCVCDQKLVYADEYRVRIRTRSISLYTSTTDRITFFVIKRIYSMKNLSNKTLLCSNGNILFPIHAGFRKYNSQFILKHVYI